MTSASAAILLQARAGSRRLPGKALAPVDGRPVLEHCLRRLAAAGAAPVVLATTTLSDDDALAATAARLGAGVFRGAGEDVLGRFARCARARGLEYVVRATGDNPGVDLDAAARVLAALRASGADYVREEGLPLGAAVEGMTGEALQRAAMLATEASDREHVTTFVRRRPDLFEMLTLAAPGPIARPDVRLTVDTAGDLEMFREVHRAAGSRLPGLEALIAAWDAVLRRSVA